MTNSCFDVIAFDADDTLWHNEIHYTSAKQRFGELLSRYLDPEIIIRQLNMTEMKNIDTYGYGIKSFTLSMIETAIALSGGQVQASEIQAIIELAREMLEEEVTLFDQVEETLISLSEEYDLLLITKGDTFEQEHKIKRTGLAGYFRHIEVVGEKSAAVYREILRKYGINPSRFLMVGNSLRSDIIPVIEIGGQAIYIPYKHTWEHENMVDQPVSQSAYHEAPHIGALPDLIVSLDQC
jgi:putative hydrolase of the HAD superfamily